MPIIVAGKLRIEPAHRQEFIEKSCVYVRAARRNPQCRDFAVSPDPIDDDNEYYPRQYTWFNASAAGISISRRAM